MFGLYFKYFNVIQKIIDVLVGFFLFPTFQEGFILNSSQRSSPKKNCLSSF